MKPVIFSLIIFLFTGPVHAKSWQDTIKIVQKKADILWEKGERLGADINLGTAVNELDIPRHQCTILGRMLGHAEAILQLEAQDEPILSEHPDSSELVELMLYSRSLSNWAFVARSALTMTINERKHVWNLNCVGKMGIPKRLYETVASPSADFEVEGTDLRVLGDINNGFFNQFVQQLRKHPEVTRVVLGSGGGSVLEALKVGFLIRDYGLDTTLSSSCYSACTLVFLGGVKRTIWSPYPRLGFHQVSNGSGKAVPLDSETYRLISEYSVIMGVNPSFVVLSMLKATPSEMFEPDLEQLCSSKVTTWIQRLCF